MAKHPVDFRYAMWKILICISLTTLGAARKTENTVSTSSSASYQKTNITQGKSSAITANPDYIKTKSGQKLT